MLGRTRGFVLAVTALTGLPAVQTHAADAAADSADRRATSLEEVVVTATKREERLRDVPVAVSALTGSQLQDMGAQSLADYVTTLPGVAFNNYQPGVSEVVIRGISDLLAGKDQAADEYWQPVASRHAAAFAVELLDSLGAHRPQPA